jgi:hypothetical protein
MIATGKLNGWCFADPAKHGGGEDRGSMSRPVWSEAPLPTDKGGIRHAAGVRPTTLYTLTSLFQPSIHYRNAYVLAVADEADR